MRTASYHRAISYPSKQVNLAYEKAYFSLKGWSKACKFLGDDRRKRIVIVTIQIRDVDGFRFSFYDRSVLLSGHSTSPTDTNFDVMPSRERYTLSGSGSSVYALHLAANSDDLSATASIPLAMPKPRIDQLSKQGYCSSR